MTIDKFVVAIAGLSFALAAHAPQAHAAFTINQSIGGSPTVSTAHVVNFDNLPLGSTDGSSGGVSVAFAGGALVATGNTGTYTAPYISNSQALSFGDTTALGYDATPYLSTSLGTVTLTFATTQNYLGMLWGSLDPFNTLTFYNGSTVVGALTGRDVVPINQGDLGPNGTFYVNLLSSLSFDSVVAASGGYSFEFDNLAYAYVAPESATPAPEPFSLGLLALGLLGIGYTAARRSTRAM